MSVRYVATLWVGIGATVAPAQDLLLQLDGAGVDSALGRGVDAFGDLDGDGNDDLLVADMTSVSVRVGSSGAPILTLSTSGVVAGVGDVDLDGVNDLMVQFTIYSGASGLPIGTVVPSAPGSISTFIRDLDGAGDVDQDGYVDVLVGTPYEGLADPIGGAVRLYSGRTFGELHVSASVFTEDYYGWHVGGAGDINADGFRDFVASTDAVGGYSRVYSGKDGALLASYGFSFSVSNAPIAPVGDPDGDGYADYAVTSSGGFDLAVYSGMTGGVIGAVDLPGQPYSILGAEVGDFDGDGRDDVLIGQSSSNRVRVYSGALDALLFDITEPAGGSFGDELVGLGDVDGDGLRDFAVGAPTADVGGFSGAGFVRVYGGQSCGAIAAYGHGCAGSAFIRPDLAMEGCAARGAPVTFSIEEGLGGATALLLFGLQPAQIPLFGGCTLNVTPVLGVVLPVPLSPGGPGQGSATIHVSVPTNAPVATLVMQAFVPDPGAPFGVSNTNGLSMTIAP